MLKIDTEDNLLTRSKHSPSILQVYPKVIDRWSTLFRWSSRSTRSSTPARTNDGSGIWDYSSTIPHFTGQRNTAPTKNLKGHQTIHSWALWRYLEELIQHGRFKAYILTPGAAFGLLNPQLFQIQHLINNIRQSIDYTVPDKLGTFPSNFNSMYSIQLLMKYYSMILAIAVHPSTCPIDGIPPLRGGHKTTPLLRFLPLGASSSLLGFPHSEDYVCTFRW